MEESIMVMEKARPHLEALSKLAPQLNKATDLYMAELKQIEEQLNRLNLGIELELEGTIQKSNSKNKYNDDGEAYGPFHSGWTIGYGKDSRGTWCLIVREYEVDESSNQWVEEDATPLLQVSRDLRIAAAEKIPDLLKVIEQEVKKKIATLAKVSDQH